MTTQARVTILSVDDHPLIREGLAALVATEPGMQVIGEAADGEEAIERYREPRPDVVLMDLVMPTMDGLDATRAILAEFPDAKIIMLTTYDGDEDIFRALAAGAKGYLLKSMLRKEVQKVIRTVRDGGRGIGIGNSIGLGRVFGEHTARSPTPRGPAAAPRWPSGRRCPWAPGRRRGRSDAPVGRTRTPNVPARGRGVGVRLSGSGGPRRVVAWRPVLTVLGSRADSGPDGPRVEGGLRAAWAVVVARVRRCARIWSITDGCVMNATIRIAPWQAGHARGSTSKICWSRVAHRRVASAGPSRGAGTIAGGVSASASSA